MAILAVVLVVLAVIVGVYSAFQPGLVGIGGTAQACLLAILARLAQASYQHKCLMKLGQENDQAEKPVSSEDAEQAVMSKRILASEVPAYEQQGWRVLRRFGMFAEVSRE